MKTIIFASASIAALMLAGAAAAAAPPPMTSQTYSSHSADIEQINTVQDKATINQNDAAVTDTGSNKTAAIVIQGINGTKSSNSTAQVDQSGAGQSALTMQATNLATTANTVKVTQSGDHNQAFGYQNGAGNKITITQSQTQGYAQSAINAQGVTGASDMNNGVNAAIALRTKTVDQDRADTYNEPDLGYAKGSVVQDWTTSETANLNQAGSYNLGTIVQSYDSGSTATITQDSAAYGNSASIRQQGSITNGSANNATITQNGGSLNGAQIAQIDASNSSATVQQNGGSTAESFNYQQGANNNLTVNQSGVVFSTSDVRQAGGFDTANVNQTNAKYNSNVTVNQGLANSWASVTQMNTSNTTATINQGVVSSFRSGR